jgi:hypothetical protein
MTKKILVKALAKALASSDSKLREIVIRNSAKLSATHNNEARECLSRLGFNLDDWQVYERECMTRKAEDGTEILVPLTDLLTGAWTRVCAKDTLDEWEESGGSYLSRPASLRLCEWADGSALLLDKDGWDILHRLADGIYYHPTWTSCTWRWTWTIEPRLDRCITSFVSVDRPAICRNIARPLGAFSPMWRTYRFSLLKLSCEC